MQRVLIVGVSSLVGTHLALRLREKHLVTGTFDRHRPPIDGVPFIKLSLRQDTPWGDLCKWLRPDIIYYCAAERDEKICQRQPLLAITVNVETPALIARAIQGSATKLVYFSTSKVFSGERGDYTENDEPDPLGHYGHSKARGEDLLSEFERVFILRLGTLYGLGPVPARSLLNRLLVDIWEGKSTLLVEDEMRSFQSIDWVAEASERLLSADDDQAGVYNLPSPTKESHYSFSLALAQALHAPVSHLRPVSGARFSQDLAVPVGRGADTSLNGKLFEDTFRIAPKTTANYLKLFAESLKQGHF